MVWGIRMRMTQRGLKDVDAESLQVFSGTSSRLSQLIVVSECVVRKWMMTTLDVKKVFLKGATYQELADLTCEATRDVNFEVTADTARSSGPSPASERLITKRAS